MKMTLKIHATLRNSVFLFVSHVSFIGVAVSHLFLRDVVPRERNVALLHCGALLSVAAAASTTIIVHRITRTRDNTKNNWS
jgi:hypothetical protein